MLVPTPTCSCALFNQDPLDIERHMAGKRFQKLLQQRTEELEARERKRQRKEKGDDVLAIEDRLGKGLHAELVGLRFVMSCGDRAPRFRFVGYSNIRLCVHESLRLCLTQEQH